MVMFRLPPIINDDSDIAAVTSDGSTVTVRCPAEVVPHVSGWEWVNTH